MLDVEGLSVRFGGHAAVSDLSLTAKAGHITGLIGPNGAGKTTTFNAICGVVTPTSGSITIDGHVVTKEPTHERARRGLGRTFQRIEVFGSLTVRENVLTAGEIRQAAQGASAPPQLLAEGDPGALGAEVDLILDRVGLSAVADQIAGSLPTGTARLVELARALAARPRVLLLDEPASGQDDAETERFSQLLVELAEAGLALLLVEHDIALVMSVCADIYVLDFGTLLAHGAPDAVRQDEAVRAAYLGSMGSVG